MKSAGKDFTMGSGQGRGLGGRRGQGRGGGQGRNKGGAFGPGGYCVCTKCGARVLHQRGVKCTTLKCPDCGPTLIREELVKKKQELQIHNSQ